MDPCTHYRFSTFNIFQQWTFGFRSTALFPGFSDLLLSKMAKCSSKRVCHNACRNLHSTISRFKKALPIKISYVSTTLRRSRKRKQEVPFQFPVLRTSDWLEYSLDNGGHWILGGRDLEVWEEFSGELTAFWTRFRALAPNHPYFNQSGPEDWAMTLPLALHGDEGRGKAKKACMVMSAQSMLPLHGNKSNMAGQLGKKFQNAFLGIY